MEGESRLGTAFAVIKAVAFVLVVVIATAFVLRNRGPVHTVTVDWVVVEATKVSASALILASLLAGAVGWSLLWHVVKFLGKRKKSRS